MLRVLVATLVLLTSTALAQTPDPVAAPLEKTRIAILEVSMEGDAPPELRAQLEPSLEKGLTEGGFEVVGRGVVLRRMQDAPELIDCMTTLCLERMAQILEVSRFVRVRVQAAGAAYMISVELFGTRAAAGPVARATSDCAVCTIGEVSEAAAEAGRSLAEAKEGHPSVPVTFRTEPPGARVIVGGRVLGITPFTTAMQPGTHGVRFEREGSVAVQREVEVKAQVPGETVEVVSRLETAAATPVSSAPPSRGGGSSRWLKWVALGGTAAALAGGTTLLWLDGRDTDCPGELGQAMGEPCASSYDTAVPGFALTAGAAVLGGVTTWLFVRDARGDDAAPTRAAAIQLVPGGGLLNVRGMF